MTSFIRSLLFICAAALPLANSVNADDFYTLQLQVDPGQEVSMQRLTQLPKIHSATFSPTEHFVYLGQFNTEAEANKALDKIQREIEPQISSFHPMIVELFINPNEQVEPRSMARQKRLEPTPEALRAEPAESHTALTPPIVTAAAVATDYQEPSSDTNSASVSEPPETPSPAPQTNNTSKVNSITVKKGYSIQVAVFKNQNNYRRFIDDHPSGDFYCNIDTSESTVIHMGIFDKFSSAKQSLKEAGDFGDLSPYIITLDNAQLTLCR